MCAGESNVLVAPIKATTHCDIAEHQKDHEIGIIRGSASGAEKIEAATVNLVSRSAT